MSEDQTNAAASAENEKNRKAMEALMSSVPDYRELLKDPVKNGERIKRIDAILDKVDYADSSAALTWGSQVTEHIREVTRKLEQDMEAEDRAIITGMITNAFEKMKDTQSLSEQAMKALEKGQDVSKFVGRNKWIMGGTVAAATGALFIPFVGPFAAPAILAAGGVGMAGKEATRKKRLKSGDDAEAITHRVREAANSFNERIKELKEAQKRIPGMIERADQLSDESLKAFLQLTELVCAGREIERRIDEALPQIKGETVEELEQRDNLIAFKEAFHLRLAQLSQGRAGFAAKREQMRISKSSLIQTASNIEGLVSSELENAKFDLQVAGANTRAMEMSNAVVKTRTFIHGIRKDAQLAAETGSKLSMEGRADHAKQYQAQSEILQRNINWMKEARAKKEQFDRESKAAEQQMEKDVTELVDLRKAFDTADVQQKTGKEEKQTLTTSNDNAPAPTEKKPKMKLSLGGGTTIEP